MQLKQSTEMVKDTKNWTGKTIHLYSNYLMLNRFDKINKIC